MGKKFGVNTKAAEARERKATQDQFRKQELAGKKEVEEAKLWDRGAYHNPKKEAEEAKRLEKLAKKKERDQLEKAEAEEIASIAKHPHQRINSAPSKPVHVASSVTTSKIASKSEVDNTEINNFQELPEYSASNIDDALSLLEATTLTPTATALEKHPERRMEAAYKRFEEIQMPILKQENPGLRHSQLTERMFRLWKKSSDNPMNQPYVSHRTTREEELALIQTQKESKLEQFRVKRDK